MVFLWLLQCGQWWYTSAHRHRGHKCLQYQMIGVFPETITGSRRQHNMLRQVWMARFSEVSMGCIAMAFTNHTVWGLLQVQETLFAILIRVFMPSWPLLLTYYFEVLTLYLPEVIGTNNPSLSLNVYYETKPIRDQLPRNIPQQIRLQACISSVVVYVCDCSFSRYPVGGWWDRSVPPYCQAGRTRVQIQVSLTQRWQYNSGYSYLFPKMTSIYSQYLSSQVVRMAWCQVSLTVCHTWPLRVYYILSDFRLVRWAMLPLEALCPKHSDMLDKGEETQTERGICS